MYRLQQQFGQRADFVSMDVDDLAVRSTRMGLGMRNRSHYMLIDGSGNRIAQWFGPLNEQAMFEQLETMLSQLGL